MGEEVQVGLGQVSGVGCHVRKQLRELHLSYEHDRHGKDGLGSGAWRVVAKANRRDGDDGPVHGPQVEQHSALVGLPHNPALGLRTILRPASVP